VYEREITSGVDASRSTTELKDENGRERLNNLPSRARGGMWPRASERATILHTRRPIFSRSLVTSYHKLNKRLLDDTSVAPRMPVYSIYSDIPLPNYTIDRATIPTATILVECRGGATSLIRRLLRTICSSVPAPPDMYAGKRSQPRHIMA
jgi:hypothetical protein